MLVQSGHHIITTTCNVLKLSKEELPGLLWIAIVNTRVLQACYTSSTDLRRNQLKLMMMYRILHGLIYVQHSLPLTYSNLDNTCRGHTCKFTQPATRLGVDCYKFSFFPSTTRLWSSLPSSVVRERSFN